MTITPARLMVLTDRGMAAEAGHDLADVVADAVGAGAPALLLREKDLPRAERHRLAMRLRRITADAGAALVVAADVALAREVGADGVHLSAADPWSDGGGAAGLWMGRSCHSIGELTAAARRTIADYVTFSPVFATTSKPGYGPALGIDGLAAGCEAVAHTRSGLAVYALGGIGSGLAGACRAAGADGVAVMGAIMRADDPGAVVRSLVDELVAAGADA